MSSSTLVAEPIAHQYWTMPLSQPPASDFDSRERGWKLYGSPSGKEGWGYVFVGQTYPIVGYRHQPAATAAPRGFNASYEGNGAWCARGWTHTGAEPICNGAIAPPSSVTMGQTNLNVSDFMSAAKHGGSGKFNHATRCEPCSQLTQCRAFNNNNTRIGALGSNGSHAGSTRCNCYEDTGVGGTRGGCNLQAGYCYIDHLCRQDAGETSTWPNGGFDRNGGRQDVTNGLGEWITSDVNAAGGGDPHWTKASSPTPPHWLDIMCESSAHNSTTPHYARCSRCRVLTNTTAWTEYASCPQPRCQVARDNAKTKASVPDCYTRPGYTYIAPDASRGTPSQCIKDGQRLGDAFPSTINNTSRARSPLPLTPHQHLPPSD
eukprot:COSAG01_NODE_2333_length_7887_cov_3.085645_1_plen_375_part_00